MEQVQFMAGGVLVGWLLTQFLNRTVGTSYVKTADFRAFKATHDNQCNQCQNRRDLALIRRMVVELAIKAGVPAHEISKIIETKLDGTT